MKEAMWERMQATDPEIAAQIEAYTAGVNAWLADLRAGRNGAALPPEYGFFLIHQGPDDLAPWRPQDTVALHLAGGGHGQRILINDLLYPELMETFDEAVCKDVVRFRPARLGTGCSRSASRVAPPLAAPASVPPARPRPGVARAVRSLLDEVARTSPLGGRGPGAGSNNWVVAPGLSDSGFAMLASDPHMGLVEPGLVVPPATRRCERSRPMRVSGAALPEAPLLFRGTTKAAPGRARLRTSTTSTSTSKPSPRRRTTPPRRARCCSTASRFRCSASRRASCLNGGDVVTYPIEVVPHHGPMLPDPDLGDAVEGLAATGMTMRWTGQELSNDFRTYPRSHAGTERRRFPGRAAQPRAGVAPNNYVWADVHGDIAYSPYFASAAAAGGHGAVGADARDRGGGVAHRRGGQHRVDSGGRVSAGPEPAAGFIVDGEQRPHRPHRSTTTR